VYTILEYLYFLGVNEALEVGGEVRQVKRSLTSISPDSYEYFIVIMNRCGSGESITQRCTIPRFPDIGSMVWRCT